jgi:hypothetical protein
LVFSLGGNEVRFPECRVDRGSIVRNESGEVWHISVVDRRWKWRFGHVSGRYNVRRADSKIQSAEEGTALVVDTERSPQQLAEIYLEAMGETSYDVSQLPNEARPAVELDYDNPAQALADLCESLGCRVVLRLDNSVAIVRVGVGLEVPHEFLLEDGPSFERPVRPDRVAVVCGPNVYEVDFPLEAVGLDAEKPSEDSTQETIKPIEQLSYRPKAGWSNVDVPNFYNVGADDTEEDLSPRRALAAKSVFRYYRLRMPVTIPGYGSVDKREQIALIDEQVSMTRENGARVPLPAAVFGVWHSGHDAPANSEAELTPPPRGETAGLRPSYYTRGFSIDAARGLVIFDEPVYSNATPEDAKVTFAPAQLMLRAKCQVRDAKTSAVSRYLRERATNATYGAGCLVLKHDELTLTHAPSYDPASYGKPPEGDSDVRKLLTVASNQREIDDACDRHIEAALAEFERPSPRLVRAAGIVPVDLDGAIVQVTYNVGPSGATTSVSRNSESPQAAAYRERRQAEAARQAATDARRTRAEVLDLFRRVAGGRRRAR